MTRYSAAARILSGIVIFIGVMTLMGWLLDISVLERVMPGLVSMKVNTALCLVLTGSAVLFRTGRSQQHLCRRVAKTCASVAIGIAGLTLAEWGSGHDFGIDQLLVRGQAEPVSIFVPGRMSPVTASCLFLLGTASLTLDWKTRREKYPAQYLTLAALGLTLLAFVGYFYGAQGLYSVAPLASIALHTVLALCLLCAAIFLARPEWEIMRLLGSPGLGGAMARRMLLPAFLVPLVLGGLAVAGERAGLFLIGFGLALFTVSLIGVFGFLIVWAAHALDRIDAERQQGVNALRETAARLDAIISSAMDAIVTLDDRERIVTFNAAAETMFGVRARDVLGQPISRFIPERLQKAKTRSSQEQERINDRTQGRFLGVLGARRADGEEFPIEASVSEVTVGGRNIMVVIVRDISERQFAERALRESEERLRLFIEHAPAAIAMFDREMRYLAASNRWLADFGCLGRQVVGCSHYDLFPGIPERWRNTHQRCLAGAVERAEEDIFELSDGSRQWIRWEVRPWYSGQDRVGGIIIMSENITERKLAEKAVRESEERFRTLADAIPQLVWIARADGSIMWFNRRFYDYTGTTPGQIEGWNWESVHDPKVLPKVMEQWKNSIATSQPFEMEIPLKAADGSFHPFLTRVMPFKDGEGKVLLWFGTNTDIADIVEARETLAHSRSELERLVRERTAQLVESNANLQAFAYSAAHDLRAPLRSIAGFSDVMLQDYGPKLEEQGRSILERIIDCAGQMSRLLDDLLEYSKMSGADLRVEEVSLQEAASEALALLDGDLRSKNVVLSVDSNLPQVIGHPATIVLMISNLVSNAIKFMAPDVQPKVRLWAEPGKGTGFVRFWVEDNGIGIAPAEQEKLFNAFQRLHGKQYPGTGLGLAMVRKGAERMGGHVGVESEPGKGSRFWLEFKKSGQ